MKKLLFLIILSAAVFPAFAAETGGSFTIGNNNLPSEALSSSEFQGDSFPWGASLFWKKEANDVSGIEIGLSRDQVLNNMGYTNFYYNEELFNISVGPFFGLFNNTSTLIKSGISSSIRVNIPGVAFAQFDTRSTIGGRLISVGDYIQEANSISIGFYVYNAIVTAMVDTKSFSSIISDEKTQSVDFVEYALITDLFQKNVPYTVTLKLAYQQKVRIIEDTSSSIETLNNVVLGTDLSLSPFEFLSVFIKLESGLYSFGSIEDTDAGTKELLTFSDELPGSFLFNATLGFSLDLDNINN